MELKNRIQQPQTTIANRVALEPQVKEEIRYITEDIIEKIEELLQTHRDTDTDPHQTAHLLAYHIEKMIKIAQSAMKSDLSSSRTNTSSSVG